MSGKHVGHQVVSEFRKGRPKRCDKKSQHAKDKWRNQWMLRVYGKSVEAKSLLRNARKKAKKTRATAYVYCRALDHQLALAGISMKTFLPEEKSRPSTFLQRGEKRYFAYLPGDPREVDMGPAVKRLRCIVKSEDGSKRLEVPRFEEDVRPHLSLCGDQGGSGLPAWNFLFQKLRLRGSFYSDPFHRVARDWKLALQQSSLWSFVVEGQVLLTWLHGPWKSEMWFSNMVDAMEEYIRECRHAEASKSTIAKTL